MKKHNLQNRLAKVLVMVLVLILAISPISTLAETAPTKTEVYSLEGFETATQEVLDKCPGTDSMKLTAGITNEGYLAEGATNAVKISYLEEPDYWGQIFIYHKEDNVVSKPFETLPTKMSDWDVLRFFVYVPLDECSKGIPSGVQLHLINEYNESFGEKHINFTWSDVDDFSGWIELEPSDFTKDGAALTAFPDAYTILFKVTGENNEYDPYKPFSMYLSGMEMTREVPDTDGDKNGEDEDKDKDNDKNGEDGDKGKDEDKDKNEDKDKDKGEESKFDEFGRLNAYNYTLSGNLEKATQAQLDGFFKSGFTLTAGITDKSLIAKNADSAIKLSYGGSQGWGQVLFYHENKVLPFDILPKNLPAYDGIGFYLNVSAPETGLPTAVNFIFLDEYGMEGGKAKVDIYDESRTFEGWVYLTPKDFGLDKFPEEFSFLFKVTGEHDEYDGYKKFDMYFSGLSAYTVKSSDEKVPPTGDMPMTGTVIISIISAMAIALLLLPRKRFNVG